MIWSYWSWYMMMIGNLSYLFSCWRKNMNVETWAVVHTTNKGVILPIEDWYVSANSLFDHNGQMVAMVLWKLRSLGSSQDLPALHVINIGLASGRISRLYPASFSTLRHQTCWKIDQPEFDWFLHSNFQFTGISQPRLMTLEGTDTVFLHMFPWIKSEICAVNRKHTAHWGPGMW